MMPPAPPAEQPKQPESPVEANERLGNEEGHIAVVDYIWMGTERLTLVFTNYVGRVVPGVWCYVYNIKDDDARDLGLVEVWPGYSTPTQRVLDGERTIEWPVCGKGTLYVLRKDGSLEPHKFDMHDPTTHFPAPVTIEIGECMMWLADEGERLVFAEVCWPPFAEGRLENLAEDHPDSQRMKQAIGAGQEG